MGGGEEGVDCGGPCPSCDAARGSPPAEHGRCSDPLPGSPCQINIAWALEHGLPEHPEWYSGSCLDANADPKAVQAWFYSRMPDQGCGQPCGDLQQLNLCFEPSIGGANCGVCPTYGGPGGDH